MLAPIFGPPISAVQLTLHYCTWSLDWTRRDEMLPGVATSRYLLRGTLSLPRLLSQRVPYARSLSFSPAAMAGVDSREEAIYTDEHIHMRGVSGGARCINVQAVHVPRLARLRMSHAHCLRFIKHQAMHTLCDLIYM